MEAVECERIWPECGERTRMLQYTGLQLWELHGTDAMRPNRIHVETMVAERARREER